MFINIFTKMLNRDPLKIKINNDKKSFGLHAQAAKPSET